MGQRDYHSNYLTYIRGQYLSDSHFYVVAHEAGSEHAALPIWASRVPNPLALEENYPQERITSRVVEGVPAAFQLLNVLSADECDRLLRLGEELGYHPDAPVSLDREIRHNDNMVWITDEATDDIIWQRTARLVGEQAASAIAERPLGLNARFRFYRYGAGDFFKFHTDGGWPGSRVIDGRLVANAYPDRFSQMTFLIFLNDDYVGGATRFRVNAANAEEPARYYNRVSEVDVHTPAGGVLCFPHGLHPQHCVHSGETVREGTKYIIRTDILFEL